VVDDSEQLLARRKTCDAYEQELGERTTTSSSSRANPGRHRQHYAAVLVYLGDTRRRAERPSANAQNRAHQPVEQDAILRLMNEMGNLREGDLTVKATVTKRSPAPSRLGELTRRVENPRRPDQRRRRSVTTAAESAQHTSAQLLAARKSSPSRFARTSASASHGKGHERDVGERLAVGERRTPVARCRAKSTQAVQNSISGMNEIREQIQETSKRIKRLGESSQEIGEIVELISDITEQTNVLL